MAYVLRWRGRLWRSFPNMDGVVFGSVLDCFLLFFFLHQITLCVFISQNYYGLVQVVCIWLLQNQSELFMLVSLVAALRANKNFLSENSMPRKNMFTKEQVQLTSYDELNNGDQTDISWKRSQITVLTTNKNGTNGSWKRSIITISTTTIKITGLREHHRD